MQKAAGIKGAAVKRAAVLLVPLAKVAVPTSEDIPRKTERMLLLTAEQRLINPRRTIGAQKVM